MRNRNKTLRRQHSTVTIYATHNGPRDTCCHNIQDSRINATDTKALQWLGCTTRYTKANLKVQKTEYSRHMQQSQTQNIWDRRPENQYSTHKTRNIRLEKQDSWHKTRNTRLKTRDTRHWQDSRHTKQDSRHKTQHTRPKTRVTRLTTLQDSPDLWWRQRKQTFSWNVSSWWWW